MTDWKDRALTNWKDKALLRAVDAVERHRGLKLKRSFTERIVSIALEELGFFELVEAGEALRNQTIVSEVMSASGSILPRRVVSPPDVETYEAFVAALSKVTGGSDGD